MNTTNLRSLAREVETAFLDGTGSIANDPTMVQKIVDLVSGLDVATSLLTLWVHIQKDQNLLVKVHPHIAMKIVDVVSNTTGKYNWSPAKTKEFFPRLYVENPDVSLGHLDYKFAKIESQRWADALVVAKRKPQPNEPRWIYPLRYFMEESASNTWAFAALTGFETHVATYQLDGVFHTVETTRPTFVNVLNNQPIKVESKQFRCSNPFPENMLEEKIKKYQSPSAIVGR